MARLYANENFPFPVLAELRRLGHDVLTTLDVGKAGQAIPDDAVFRFANENHRVILTLNRRHFVRLHQLMPAHCGIIVCTYDYNFLALARRIHETIDRGADLGSRLVRVNRPAKAQPF